MSTSEKILHELKHHLPFSFLAAFVGIILAFFLNFFYFNFSDLKIPFEGLHFLHVFMSAIVSSAIFYRYKKSWIFSLFVGISASIFIGSVSDVILPFFGSVLFSFKTSFHLPLIEMPLVILGGALVAGLIGIKTNFTKLPHFLHVLVSTFASLFYLFTFTTSLTFGFFVFSLIMTIFAVIVPCCFSDIIFPFFFLGEKIKHCDC